MSLSLQEAQAKVDAIFAGYASARPRTSLLSPALTTGKMYEAWVLGLLLQRLEAVEGFTVQLIGSSKVHLKSSPGPINLLYPHFELRRDGDVLEVWTDVEFKTLSYTLSGAAGAPMSAHRHELDLVIVPRGCSGYPGPKQILLGVECKNTPFTKAMARAALGVRRELSLLRGQCPTAFRKWPERSVPADPPSVLMVFSTDSKVTDYHPAGSVFGVNFVHEPM